MPCLNTKMNEIIYKYWHKYEIIYTYWRTAGKHTHEAPLRIQIQSALWLNVQQVVNDTKFPNILQVGQLSAGLKLKCFVFFSYPLSHRDI